MEKDKYYDKAYEQFQNGNYDQALENMKLSQTVSEDERKKFINQCLSFITQQYIYLIHEAINNRDYTEANQLKGMYLHLYGENKEIASIGIPTDGQSNSTSQNSPTTQMPESQVSRETERTAAEVNNASPRPTVTFVQSTSPDNSNKNIIKWSVIGVIAAVLIIALIIAVSSKSNESGQVSAPAENSTYYDNTTPESSSDESAVENTSTYEGNESNEPSAESNESSEDSYSPDENNNNSEINSSDDESGVGVDEEAEDWR